MDETPSTLPAADRPRVEKRAGEGGLEGTVKRREAAASGAMASVAQPAGGVAGGVVGLGGAKRGSKQDLLQLVLKNGLHSSQELRSLKGIVVCQRTSRRRRLRRLRGRVIPLYRRPIGSG